MSRHQREHRIGEILNTLARGGLHHRQIDRLESELAELQASQQRDQQWAKLTHAPVQPNLRNLDAYE